MDENASPTTEAPAEGAESTTPEEVSQVLGLEKPETVTAEELENEEEPEQPEAPETPETPETKVEGAPAPVESTPETPAAPEAPETPSFTLEVEDANGEKYAIASLDDLPEDFEPKNNRQIMEILDGIRNVNEEKSAWEKQQADSEVEAARQESIAKIQSSWDEEIKQLQSDKRLPVSADANNPDAKFVERRDEVFKFMAEENQKRNESGRPLLQSFEDALDKLENREAKEAAVEQAKKDKELARKRGGMVGGSSAPATSGAPVYRTGQARNASEAIHSMGLL